MNKKDKHVHQSQIVENERESLSSSKKKKQQIMYRTK